MDKRKMIVINAANVYAEHHNITLLEALDVFGEVIDLLNNQTKIAITQLRSELENG